MANYANIIVDISIEKLDRPFTYKIPKELEEQVHLGSLVVIPFGKANRKLQGFVVGITNQVPDETITYKDIEKVMDNAGVTGQLIRLAAWMKQQYGGILNQALKTVLPMKAKGKAKEVKMVELLLTKQRAMELAASFEEKKQVAKLRLINALMDDGTIEQRVLTGKLHVSTAVIKKMEEQGFVAVTTKRSYRNPIDTDHANTYRPTLTYEQQQVVEGILSCRDLKPCLIHGITGSGKTEVYMEIMQHVIDEGKQVIMLIPEIALTYQTVMRFYHRFGDRVSVLHSKLSQGERFDQLERAQKGQVDIMIGPRSALFTPFLNLGLIIIDEEHESTYKSEGIPKYHARETAIYRGEQNGARVILGSATPSVESFYQAETGQYHYFPLKHRYNGKQLPKAHVVDMREELKLGNRSMFSDLLMNKLKDRLEKKEQSILFLNRRGASGFISCRSCGSVVKCPHCDVSLTEHLDGTMQCHYCGYKIPKVQQCPVCGSGYIGGFKVGTEKVQESLQTLFPKARILRMDRDTTRTKDGYENILSAFANGEADILVGTQMIVKGHDFPKVSLVGILAADMSLNADDYRASEKTFQLLTQAAGRAGRGAVDGEVVIQTYHPEHFAIKDASSQDYESFYREEIAYRKLLHYPPKGHMLLIAIMAEKEEVAQKLSETLYEVANKTEEKVILLGPTDAKIKKIQDVYRKVIYVKAMDYRQLIKIKNTIETYREKTDYEGGYVSFDFDPIQGF
ncbi:MAG: primosomal protein N' [Lachnospiraceae bacterium]|nr:primosomal protein N' [Lachnospiraceae bacterium]